MNGNCSTTKRKRSERLPNAAKLAFQWNHVDWKKAEAEVNRLQARIAKATKEKKWNTVKRLQYLLTHSYYAKLLDGPKSNHQQREKHTRYRQTTVEHTCAKDVGGVVPDG